MPTDLRDYHNRLIKDLETKLAGNSQRLKVKKKTVSNLFRYEGRQASKARLVNLGRFNEPLFLDEDAQTLDVQGLTTYEHIVDYTLPRGFLPTITPELKHITVGGATVGIGIESNTYRYGFVHDSLLEADVLLPDGRVVTCAPDNDYADLFRALPNSYGTLGYVLRAKLRLIPAKPFVTLHTERFDNPRDYLKAMKEATDKSTNDYVEGLVYSKTELYLTVSRHANTAKDLRSIYGGNVFYKDISRPGEFSLPTAEYMFRFDPEWFWAIPETTFYHRYRQLAPRDLRNSAFYTRYVKWQTKLAGKLPFAPPEDPTLEQLIQDWEVPWKHAESLLTFALENLDLDGKPWMVTPVKSTARATLYPIKPELYLNLGSYSFAKKQPGKPDYYNTKILDDFCFGHDGIKMLYSSTFLSQPEFDRIYNGAAYAKLKRKYDPQGLLPTLYEKTVKAF